jgi:hypothetical protein
MRASTEIPAQHRVHATSRRDLQKESARCAALLDRRRGQTLLRRPVQCQLFYDWQSTRQNQNIRMRRALAGSKAPACSCSASFLFKSKGSGAVPRDQGWKTRRGCAKSAWLSSIGEGQHFSEHGRPISESSLHSVYRCWQRLAVPKCAAIRRENGCRDWKDSVVQGETRNHRQFACTNCRKIATEF